MCMLYQIVSVIHSWIHNNVVLLIGARRKCSNAGGTRIKHIIGRLHQYVTGHEYNSEVGIIPEQISLSLAEQSRSNT